MSHKVPHEVTSPACLLFACLLLAGATLAACSAGGPGPAGSNAGAGRPVPDLTVEAAVGLDAAAAGIRRLDPSRLEAAMRLTGLQSPGDPIHVVLAPESSTAALEAPAWVAGYADSSADLIVLFPQRSPSYPDRSLDGLLGHEVTHVLIDRAAAGGEVPRWFHEGLAMVAGGAWGIDDRTRVTLALLFGDQHTLAQVDAAFASDDADRIARAYALAGAFMHELLVREGRDAAARVLAGVADGLDFEAAFARGTGIPLPRAEEMFWRQSDRWYRWVPIVTSSVTLWAGIVLLSVWAYRRRRVRTQAIRARWEQDGQAQEPERQRSPRRE